MGRYQRPLTRGPESPGRCRLNRPVFSQNNGNRKGRASTIEQLIIATSDDGPRIDQRLDQEREGPASRTVISSRAQKPLESHAHGTRSLAFFLNCRWRRWQAASLIFIGLSDNFNRHESAEVSATAHIFFVSELRQPGDQPSG